MSTRNSWLLPLALAASSCWLTIPSLADSQARIVRLSQVDGEVQIDRNAGRGFEQAFLNLPITQGATLRTGPGARAEVEFEDGSTLRMTPATVVEFPGLALHDSGARATSVNLQQGTAYLNFRGGKGEEFSLGFGQEKLALTKPAHLRVELKDNAATVAVFKGDVDVESPSGRVAIDKKHSAMFDLAEGRYTLANNLEADPYDDWDKQQDQYQQRYSTVSGNFSPYGYGVSDLNYYGGFYDLPGYGVMWQPYLVGAGWDPFMNGSWMWYPGSGYTWVSGYPWGWMPYRYGSWVFVPASGWFWQPGRAWSGWNTGPHIVNAPATFMVPRPPSRPGQFLAVNRVALPAPGFATQNRLQIRADSAGLGIPRGSVRDLGRVSQQFSRPAGGAGAMNRAPLAGSMHGSGGARVVGPHGGPTSHTSSMGGASSRMSAPAPSSHSSSGSSHK
jgi:hypothetical protein